MKCILGQETNPKVAHIWSASLSYAPVTTFFYYKDFQNTYNDYYNKGISELTYPFGTNLRIEYNLSNRLSLSSGLNMKVQKDDNLKNIISEWSGSYYEKSTDYKYIFEIPIQISFQILHSPKIFDPYIITGLRNSYFKRSYTGDYTIWEFSWTSSGKIDKHDSKYIMFYGIGAGTNINITKSVSLMIESNLNYTISGFGYLEFQGGFRYSFK